MTRVIYHPYATDDMGVTVDVTEMDAAQIVEVVGTPLSAQQVRDLQYALDRGRDINWPFWGCIRYIREPGPTKHKPLLSATDGAFRSIISDLVSEPHCTICHGPCLRQPPHGPAWR